MLDPWTYAEIEDYGRLMEEFGIERFLPLELPATVEVPRLFKEGIVFGHRGFGPVLSRMRTGQPFGIMSGLMPSGRMHLGHKMVIDQINYFQRFGAKVFIGVADLESYATRNMPLAKAREIAVESYIKNYLALGLGLDGLEVYFQSTRTLVKDLAFTLGRKVNLSTMRSIYGFGDQTNLAHVHAPLIQAGDILHPQLKLGPMPVVVPVGVDQDPHIRLCRDLSASTRIFNPTITSDGKVGVFVKVDENVRDLISRAEEVLRGIGFLDLRSIPDYKAIYIDAATPGDLPAMDSALAELERRLGYMGLMAPASTYHYFIRGLTGEKMSSSKPETAIFLDDEIAEASSKLKKALTGGRDTAEEQRKLGGNPHKCAVFETMLFHTVDDTKEISRIEQECRTGARLCGQCKKEAVSHLVTFLKDIKEKRSQREHLVKDIISPD